MADRPPDTDGARTVDWNEITRRLEASREALQRSRHITPEERKRLLRARARELARAKEEPKGGTSLNVVVFLLAHETYAVPFSQIREACRVKEIVPLPGAPSFVIGITNVRGRILSVIDLKQFFDLPGKGMGDLNRLIILHSEQMEFGILADALLGIRSLSADELQFELPTLTGIREEYLKGVTSDGLILLDAAKMLSDNRIVVHEVV